jgi:DNA repair protein RecO (recombination protein O)
VLEPEPDPARFAALSTAVLATLHGPPRPATLRQYELRLLSSLGLLPPLDQCAVCGEALDDPSGEIAMDERKGGALCPLHAGGAPRWPAEVAHLATGLLADDPEGTARDALSSAPALTRRRLRDLLHSFVRAQLRRPLRSLQFFAQIGADAGD